VDAGALLGQDLSLPFPLRRSGAERQKLECCPAVLISALNTAMRQFSWRNYWADEYH